MNKFEDYLKEIHAKQYRGTDDQMPDDFQNWMEDLDNAELIEYGNQAMEEK